MHHTIKKVDMSLVIAIIMFSIGPNVLVRVSINIALSQNKKAVKASKISN